LSTDNKFAGICVDFEEPTAASRPNLLTFMQELHAAFQPRGLAVAQAFPFDDTEWDYKASPMQLTTQSSWLTTSTGWKYQARFAGQDWYERTLATRMTSGSKQDYRSIGSYGYDWVGGESEAREVTVQEASLAARDSEASITFDDATKNPHFNYTEEDNSEHDVWFLEA
jgi:spore germination protein YaaH